MSEEEGFCFKQLTETAYALREVAGYMMYHFKDESNNDILIVSHNTECFIHHEPSESEGVRMSVVDALAWVNSIRKIEPDPKKKSVGETLQELSETFITSHPRISIQRGGHFTIEGRSHGRPSIGSVGNQITTPEGEIIITSMSYTDSDSDGRCKVSGTFYPKIA